MDLKSVAMTMFPYWILGALTIWATVKSGFGNLVRVEKKPLLGWLKFLCIITAYRVFIFSLFPNSVMSAARNITIIPWPLTLTVFWEDACHTLPLLLIRNLIGTKKWTWPIHALLMLMVMIEFGLGHVYQGLSTAVLLSFYIPYTLRLGKKYGFGTVMVGHTLYDFTTIVSIKLLTGL